MALSAKEARKRRDRLRAKKQSGQGLSSKQQARMRAAKKVIQKKEAPKPERDSSPKRAQPTFDSRKDAKQTFNRIKEKKDEGKITDKQRARLRASRAYLQANEQESKRGDIKSNYVRTNDGTRIVFDKDKDKARKGSPAGGSYPRGATSLVKGDRKQVNRLIGDGWTTRAPKKGGFDTQTVNVRHQGVLREPGVGSRWEKDPGRTSLTLYRKDQERSRKGPGPERGGRKGTGKRDPGNSEPVVTGRPKEPPTLGTSGSGNDLPAFGSPPSYETAPSQSGYNGGVGYRQGPEDNSVDPIGAAGSDGFIRTHWDTSPERAIDYGDRLGNYNAANIDYLSSAGKRSDYEMGSYLHSFASAIPKAPDTSDGYGKVLEFLERANKRLY